MEYEILPKELSHLLSCVVESGYVTLKPSQMYYVAKMQHLDYFKDGDTITLVNDFKEEIVCQCLNYPFYWRWFFNLRIWWRYLTKKERG